MDQTVLLNRKRKKKTTIWSSQIYILTYKSADIRTKCMEKKESVFLFASEKINNTIKAELQRWLKNKKKAVMNLLRNIF